MLTRGLVAQAEAEFGTPREISLEAELSERELGVIGPSLRRLRTHDVTLFILDEDRIAVIRKPMFPPGVFRAPSGGVGPGETIEEGARREAFEETGLEVVLQRYLLRVRATFRAAGAWPGRDLLPDDVMAPDDPGAIRWWTHVFQARPVGSTLLDPRDTWEIAEAKWVTLSELQGSIRQKLLETGTAFFRYRAALTDAAVERIEEF
ncbi:MAG: hypothetical protein Kow00129_04710 [Thermoleophilia bacterium]